MCTLPHVNGLRSSTAPEVIRLRNVVEFRNVADVCERG